MEITVGEFKVTVRYWESPDGSQKRYYLTTQYKNHNRATYNANTGKLEFPKKAFDCMPVEVARQVVAQIAK